LHQPPWSFGFDSQTLIREEPGKTGRHPVLKYRIPHGSNLANNFIIGTTLINTHTHTHGHARANSHPHANSFIIGTTVTNTHTHNGINTVHTELSQIVTFSSGQ
jgi:hypothetical protein